MPIYQYECKNCQHDEEIFLTFEEYNPKSRRKCPECNKKQMRIVIVNSSFSVSQEPRTIGEQADKNTREMGTYELQERREADRKEREELFGKPHEPWYGKMSKEKQKEIFDEPDKKKRKKKINDYVVEGK